MPSDNPGAAPAAPEAPAAPAPPAAETAPSGAATPPAETSAVSPPSPTPAAPEPATEAAAAEPAAEPAAPSHIETPGLLSKTAEETAAAPTEKPAETAAEGAKPTEAPAAPAPEPLKYEAPPTLPEGVSLDAERLGKFDEVIGAARVPPEARQQLVDMFLAERQQWESETLAAQHRAFADVRAEWRKAAMGDAEIGGNGFATNRDAAMRMIELFVPQQHREAFENMLLITGTADHPEMFRFLTNVAKRFDEPAPPPPAQRPPPNIGQRPGGSRAADRALFYDRNNNNA